MLAQACVKPSSVGVGVLDDLPGQPLGVARDQPVADRSTIVLHVDPHAASKPDVHECAVDYVRQMVERVLPGVGTWHVGVPEAGIVERNEMEVLG